MQSTIKVVNKTNICYHDLGYLIDTFFKQVDDLETKPTYKSSYTMKFEYPKRQGAVMFKIPHKLEVTYLKNHIVFIFEKLPDEKKKKAKKK